MSKKIRLGKTAAFSLAEMMVVMLILSIVILSMIPLATKRVKREAVNPEHGAFECYYDDQGKLHQITRDANGKIVNKKDNVEGGSCLFAPKRGAMFFVINAVGGGSPGSGVREAFNGLPEGERAASDSPKIKGGNYSTIYKEFHSKFVHADPGNQVNFDDVINSDDPDIKGPQDWLKDLGTSLKVILTTTGGNQSFYTRDGSGGKVPSGGFWQAEMHNEREGCESAKVPNFTSLVENPQAENKQACFTSWMYFGKNGQPGSRAMFPLTIHHGDVFAGATTLPEVVDTYKAYYSDSLYNTYTGDPLGGVGFGLKIKDSTNHVGCFVPNGANGCYFTKVDVDKPESKYTVDCGDSTYLNAYNSIYNLSTAESITCPSSSVFLAGKGYFPTQTTLSMDATPTYEAAAVNTTRGCSYSASCGASASNNTCSYKPCLFNSNVQGYRTTDPKVVWGNFVLIFKELKKGVNFYAQAGYPGQFRTIYVSRLRSNLKITPGKPIMFDYNRSAALESLRGNDTIVEYEGDKHELVLVAEGGKPTYNSDKNTFMVGNLFNLVPAGTDKVIAHDTINDTSGSNDEYAFYFKSKESDFLYPIPDSDQMVPEYVGKSGAGGHTVYRLHGITNAFKMFRAFDGDKASDGSAPSEEQAEYNCHDGTVLTGSNDGDTSYRCKGSMGYGGAVVITW